MTISVGSRANSRETFMNLVKVGIGPGCLALPYAFTKAGFILAPLVLVLMTLMVYRNMKLIIEIKELLKSQNPTKQFATYGDMSGHLLGHNWGVVVDYLLVSMQLGICTVYFRFIPTNLSATLSSVPQSHWLILIAPCLVALTWIRHMKSLAVFSTFANVATMITIVVILLFAGQNLVHRGAFASGLPVATLATAPVFFGSAIYSFEGCGAVPSIHESMAEPKQFNAVLTQAGIVIFFCFFFTGLLCYVSYGHITSGSMTAELAARTSNPIIGLCNVMMAVAVALTYPMQAFAAVEVFERKLGIRIGEDATDPSVYTTQRSRQVLFRTVLVLFTALAAASVHQLGLIVSLFGSVNGSLIALVLPPFLDLHARKKFTLQHWLVNWMTLIFGVVGGTGGAIVAISHIVHGEPDPAGH